MGLLWSLRLLPDPGQAHGPEPQAVDRHQATKLEGSGQAGRRRGPSRREPGG